MLQRFRRFLRSPRTILLEGLAAASLSVLGAVIPQHPTLTERVRWSLDHGVLAPLARALGLDAVFSSWPFLAVLGLATTSLAIVLVEQWRRLLRELRRRPGEAAFRDAPLRVEFDRADRGATTRITGRHRAGLAGSPLFHLGLLIVIAAGLGRMLFAAEAVVHLYEGERLEPRPDAFGAQWPGPLARPVALESPVVLRALAPERYPSGALRSISARLDVLGAAPRERTVAVNAPLDLGRERIYLSGTHGCAAFVDVEWRGGTERRIFLMEQGDDRECRWSEPLPGGELLRMRARTAASGGRPIEVELRILRGTVLVALGVLRPGEELRVPGAGRLALADLRWWAKLTVTRDASAWPAYVGFVLALLGAVLMFTLVPVEEAVIVRREGDREYVTVALRPVRFAPLFRDRLDGLVRDEGGPSRG